jgi:hypothetical protein
MNELIEKIQEKLDAVEHPEFQDNWQEVEIDGEYYDCNIFSRKALLDQDDDLPDVVVDVYPTHIIEGQTNDFGDPYRDTDTTKCLGRFYPKVEAE